MTDSRIAFEAFHGSRKGKGAAWRANAFDQLADGSYADDSVQRHWYTWQRACASVPANEDIIATVDRKLRHIVGCTHVWADSGVPRSGAITRTCSEILDALKAAT